MFQQNKTPIPIKALKFLLKITFIFGYQIFLNLKFKVMGNGLLDLKSPNFLGGNNVHNLIIIGLAAFIAYKVK